MRTMRILKLSLGLVLIVGLGLASYKTFAHSQKTKIPTTNDDNTLQETTLKEPGADVTMTMDSNASKDNMDQMIHLLKEQNIAVKFSNVQRNDEGKITGIRIELSDESNGKAVSQIASFSPISNISFGRKEGRLFITQEGNEGTQGFSFINGASPFFANDSIFDQQFGMLKKFNLQDFFNNPSAGMAFNGSTANFDELEKQMLEEMNALGNSSQYSFIDDPDTNKLIIIDGKESDFETLNKLANEKKIVAVDALKPETAMSIYGSKAKDGALIVSTK